MSDKFEMTAGLEIHVRLKTKTKLFCNCSNDTFATEANSLICPVCAGYPGTLPVVNKEAIKMAIKSALALNCTIPAFSKFDRKSYFYPDLPAGFQISQFDEPIAVNGKIEFFVNGEKKSIRINRLHLENDAGKLMHEGHNSLSDLNRAGSPLAEVVTEPDFKSPDEVFYFLKEFQRIFRFLGTSDADMEKGMMRCDVNISVKEIGAKELGTKVEIKNMNSFGNAKKAVEYEIARQTKLIENGEKDKIVQETRGFDVNKGITISQRSKEGSADYRYFPEPDIPPVKITKEYIEEVKKEIPELSAAKIERFMNDLKLSFANAEILAGDLDLANYFEKASQISSNPQKTANWVVGDFLSILNESGLQINEIKMTAENLGKLVAMVENGKISGKIAKEIFKELFESGKDPEKMVEEKGLIQIQDTGEIEKFCEEVINENPGIVEEIKNGKEKAIGALVGQVMKKSQGKASPPMVNEILRKKING